MILSNNPETKNIPRFCGYVYTMYFFFVSDAISVRDQEFISILLLRCLTKRLLHPH